MNTSSESTQALDLAGIRILVVDDDEMIRLMAQRILMSRQAAVEVAESGRAALQILLRQDFDLVLVDLRMQEMDGLTFIQEARNIWPWLGFVIMTGYMDDVSSGVSASLGVTRVLSKPVRPAQLCQALREENDERIVKMGKAGGGMEQHQRQLRMLGHLGEAALTSGTFAEALLDLSEGLGELLGCDVAGLLGFSAGQNVVVLSSQNAVSERFLLKCRQEMVSRYEALSGKKTDHIEWRVQEEGVPSSPTGPEQPGRLMTIPLFVNNEVQGILLLADAEAEAMAAIDISFVYHIANVLSSILAAVTRIRQLAAHDSLTGLFNREYFDEQAERSWQLARRYGHQMAVAIMDVDYFKKVNDTHGHLVGDQVLREFAAIIKKAARGSDVVARYGGDEFVVMLPQAELESGITLVNRIRSAVESHVFCASTLGLKLTTSIGLATSAGVEQTASLVDIISLADAGLYAAKRDGRNRVRLWSRARNGKGGMERVAEGAAAETAPAGIFPEKRLHPCVLLVDDDPLILTTLQEILRKNGYATETAPTAVAALCKAQAMPGAYDVAMIDLNMPEIGGLELLVALRQTDGFVMPVVMTGEATKESAIQSLRQGAFEFIEKPVVPEELLAVISKALDHRRLRVENEHYRLRLEEMVRQKSSDLLKALDELKAAHEFTLQAMVQMLDEREHATGQHSNRVRALSFVLGKAMSLPRRELDILSHGALLHDIGKVAIPDSILLKAGPLTDSEREVIKTHAQIGYNILSSSPHMKEIAELVYSHQERYDGSGYPRGLKGDAISLGARIFAVVDAYDAMRSDRPYRKALMPEAARAEIVRCSGTHFDPAVVDAFLRHQDELEAIGCWPAPHPQ
jgi:diguanylate cyclase (GGDEF)-like protein